jgi:hypothetical protein
MSWPGELILIVCAILIASNLGKIANHLEFFADIARKRNGP